MNLFLIAAAALAVLLSAGWVLHARRQLASYRALLDMSPNGMLMLDTKRNITWHNPAAGKLLNCPRKQLTGSPLSRWLPMLESLPEPLQRQETLAQNPEGERHQVDITRLPDVTPAPRWC